VRTWHSTISAMFSSTSSALRSVSVAAIDSPSTMQDQA
jgi:hypothetical protein